MVVYGAWYMVTWWYGAWWHVVWCMVAWCAENDYLSIAQFESAIGRHPTILLVTSCDDHDYIKYYEFVVIVSFHLSKAELYFDIL